MVARWRAVILTLVCKFANARFGATVNLRYRDGILICVLLVVADIARMYGNVLIECKSTIGVPRLWVV